MRPAGSATPLPPDAVPDTGTDLFGASTAFPLAVTVAMPALVVEPAAMVRAAALRAKSPATAPIEATGMPASALRLGEMFLARDGFLIAAPEYNGSITPPLK